jgi:hypothetical protein
MPQSDPVVGVIRILGVGSGGSSSVLIIVNALPTFSCENFWL